MKFETIISKMLITELSDKVIQRVISKFQKEDPSVDENTIRSYIERFEEIKNSPNVLNKDILSYKWNDFEQLILANPKKRIKAGKVDSNTVDANLIYDNNNVQVFAGRNQQACIKYGAGHSFCISSRGQNNRYMDYRYNEKQSPYFVFKKGKLFCVIMTYKIFPRGPMCFDVWNKSNKLHWRNARKDELVRDFPFMGQFIDKLTILKTDEFEQGILDIEKKWKRIEREKTKEIVDYNKKYTDFLKRNKEFKNYKSIDYHDLERIENGIVDVFFEEIEIGRAHV